MTTPMTPTTEGKQLAADLANAEGGKVRWDKDNFTGLSPTQVPVDAALVALARLATEHLALKAKHEEALADLREIDALLENAPDSPSVIADAKAIAAKWRVETDPLVDALMSIVPDIDCGAGESPAEAVARQLRAELSKRGYEIGGKS